MMQVHQYPDAVEIMVPCDMSSKDQLTVKVDGSDGSAFVTVEMDGNEACISMSRDMALRFALALLGKVAR